MIKKAELPDSPECPKCGRAIDWESSFCHSCGVPVDAPQEPGESLECRQAPVIPPWLAKGLAMRIIADVQLCGDDLDHEISKMASSGNINSLACWLCVHCEQIAEQYDRTASEILRMTAGLKV